MTKNKSLLLAAGALFVFLCGIVAGASLAPCAVKFSPYPERKPYVVVYEDDCFIEMGGEELKIKALTVEDLENMK